MVEIEMLMPFSASSPGSILIAAARAGGSFHMATVPKAQKLLTVTSQVHAAWELMPG